MIIGATISLEVDSDVSYNQSMISTTDVCTPIYPAVLEYPPTSAGKDVVDILGCIICIAVPCPTMQIRALVPKDRNPQFLGTKTKSYKKILFLSF